MARENLSFLLHVHRSKALAFLISEGGDKSTDISRIKGFEPWEALAASEAFPPDLLAPPSCH